MSIFKLGETVQALLSTKSGSQIIEGKVLRQTWCKEKLTEPSYYELENFDGKFISSPTPFGFPSDLVFKLDRNLYSRNVS